MFYAIRGKRPTTPTVHETTNDKTIACVFTFSLTPSLPTLLPTYLPPLSLSSVSLPPSHVARCTRGYGMANVLLYCHLHQTDVRFYCDVKKQTAEKGSARNGKTDKPFRFDAFICTFARATKNFC